MLKNVFVRRYTIVVADRSTGLVRRFTLSLRPTLVTLTILAALPILMGLGARWSARTEIKQLQASNSALQIENSSYRTATGELTGQIQSLEGVVDDLGERAKLDPAAARAMQKLPAAVRSRAIGGPAAGSALSNLSSVLSTSLTSPEDTFGVLRDLLQGLESRLNFVRRDVERREQLAMRRRQSGRRAAGSRASSAAAAIRSPANTRITPGWTSPRRRASRSSPPPTTWCSRPATPTITAI